MNQTQLQAWWVWCLSLGTHETNCKQRSHGRSHSEEHAGNTTGVAPQLQLLIPGRSDAIPLSVCGRYGRNHTLCVVTNKIRDSTGHA